WFSYQVLWGAAALHPSMVELEKPVREPEAKLTHLRLGLLTGASLIAPICILLKEIRRGDLDLIEAAQLTVRARNDAPDSPERGLPQEMGERLLKLASKSTRHGGELDAALLTELGLPSDWTSGLVLALPGRGGILGVLLVAGPTQTSRPVRASLEALAMQLALA